MASTQDEARLQNARETIDSLHDLSQLLETGLDKQALSICVGMIEQGANPDTLAAVVKELRREAAALKAEQASSGER
ncbi:Mitotic-spindle organizing protein 1 [Saitozyma sp. JCM 24511]|nr:Mitotic-spindle organizing protein 1 [Saitozyma sp. JCM 24511]